MGSLKAGAFEGPILTHADVKPGMLVKGKVIAVEDFGAIVNFANGLKALCPFRHMSEFGIVEPGKEVEMEMDEEEVQLVEEGMRAASLDENGDEKKNEIKAPDEPDPPMRIVKNWKRLPGQKDRQSTVPGRSS